MTEWKCMVCGQWHKGDSAILKKHIHQYYAKGGSYFTLSEWEKRDMQSVDLTERQKENYMLLIGDSTIEVTGHWRTKKGKKEYVRRYGRESMKQKSYAINEKFPPTRIKMKDNSMYRYHASYEDKERALRIIKNAYGGNARLEQHNGKYAVYYNEKYKPSDLGYIYGKGLGTYSRTNTGGMNVALTNQVQILFQKFGGQFLATPAHNIGPIEAVEGAKNLPDAVKRYMAKYKIRGIELFSKKEAERESYRAAAAKEIKMYAERFRRRGGRDMMVEDGYSENLKKLDAQKGVEGHEPKTCPYCGSKKCEVLGEKNLAPAYARVYCKCKDCGTRYYFQA